MATSSILGGDRAQVNPPGRDTDALGPSDSSDSGSDVQGERGFDALDPGQIGGDRADLGSDSDALGTGERGPAVRDTDIVEGADIAPDRIGVFPGSGAPDDDGSAPSDAADIESLAADDIGPEDDSAQDEAD